MIGTCLLAVILLPSHLLHAAAPVIRKSAAVAAAEARPPAKTVDTDEDGKPKLAIRKSGVTPEMFTTIRLDTVAHDHEFYLGLGYQGDFKFTGLQGATVSGGWAHWPVGVGARVRVFSAKYAALRAVPSPLDDPTGFGSYSQADSELNRPRSDSDRWSGVTWEAGAEIHSTTLRSLLPKFSERVYVGLGMGSLKDSVNALSFSALFLSVEGGLQYHFSAESQHAIDLSLGVSAGQATRSGEGTSQDRRVPVMWTSASVAYVHWF